MNIVFFCQSCGARFEVSSASAGKKGRCKTCGQMMTIPKPHEVASLVAIPAMSAKEAGPGHAGARVVTKAAPRKAKSGDSLSWLAEAPEDVALSPLEVHRRPIKSAYDDDLGDGKPYAIGKPLKAARSIYSGGKPANDVVIAWRQALGVVQRTFRWLNETAYLVSTPFLMLILAGAIFRSRPMALLGATAVVLLNIGRIVAGVANLVVVPFREGIPQGITFLIPPFTFFYLSKHWGKLHKPTMRIVSPALTIGAVFLAFTFIPSLRRDGKAPSTANLKEELREGVESLEGEMVQEVKKAKSLNVESLEKEAVGKVRDAAGKLNSIGQGDAPPPSGESAVNKLLQGVGKQTRDIEKEAQGPP